MILRLVTAACIVLYVVFGIALNKRLWRGRRNADSFLHSSRDLPLPVTALSFLAANCSALEVLTMVAVSAKYGMFAVHFYWLGAVPALALLLCFLLPRYRRAGVASVPGFLGKRFSPNARLLSAVSFTALMVAIGSITLSVATRILHSALGFSTYAGIWAIALLACVFLLGGGLSAVLYAEAIQLLVFVMVLVPLTLKVFRRSGGLGHLINGLPVDAQHCFASIPVFSLAAPADRFGTFVGLGVVLSCTYWCADFLLIQRLGAARSTTAALRTPALAIVAKIFLPLVLVLPGLWVRSEHMHIGSSYDVILPRLVLANYEPVLASVAMGVMVCSLLLGLCGNIAAGVAIFTTEVWMPHIATSASELLATPRLITVLLTILASVCASLTLSSDALMENIQLAFSAFNVPVGTVFLAGILSPWFSRRAGAVGIFFGTAASLAVWKLARVEMLLPGLSRSFYAATASAVVTVLAMTVVSFGAKPRLDEVRLALPALPARASGGLLVLVFCCLLLTVCLYVRFW